MQNIMTEFLDTIDFPEDLKKIPQKELPVLAQEVRQRILEVVSSTGGHLASPLGTVELTIALHYVFNAPKDPIIWDVGHQTYTHKLLTGRRERFNTLRQYGGISGLNNREEGPYDPFTSGHAGTSLSTATGMAIARDKRNAKENVIAVIGDASLGEGMALEALNHIGHLDTNLIVVLNDNEMSISPTVGAFSKYLNRIITGPKYNKIRHEVGAIIEKMPRIGEKVVKSMKHLEELAKSILVPGLIFEELGFRYFGPIDGHNIDQLIETFQRLPNIEGPVLIHVLTKKGKGYEHAEQRPEKFHGVGAFDLLTGKKKKKEKEAPDKIVIPAGSGISYTEAFSESLVKIAAENEKVIGITAAMPEGTGLNLFQKNFPDRYFDVGMAEQHAVGFSAGLAKKGFIPVCAIYSSFLQRSYDQIIHDVTLQDLQVIFAIDRAGIVGADGVTHQGVMDLAYLRNIPNLTVLAPKDTDELDDMLKWAVTYPHPVSIRYPRGECAYPKSVDYDRKRFRSPVELGKAQLLREGSDCVIFAIGNLAYAALDAAELLKNKGVSAAVVNARFAWPLDEELIKKLSSNIKYFFTVEDGAVDGGFGGGMLEALSRLEIDDVNMRLLGIPREFVEHGTQKQLLGHYGLSSDGIADKIVSVLKKSKAVLHKIND